MPHCLRAIVKLGSESFRTDGPITTIAFSPDGKCLAVANATSRFPHATLFDAQTGRASKVLTLADPLESSVLSLAFAPDSSKLIWGNQAVLSRSGI